MTFHRARLRVLMAFATAAGALLFAGSARADTVTDWSLNASNELIRDRGQGAIAFPHMAMVHAAMFDAVNAIDRRYEPYMAAPRAKRWFSQDAAAVTAAYRVLVDGAVVAPAQRQALKDELKPVYDAAIGALEAGTARDGGVATGEAAAWAMIAARTGDGRFGEPGFAVPPHGHAALQPGDWRPTGGVNDPSAWLRNVEPFFVHDPDRFLSRGPNELTSRAYAREYAEVKSLGKSDSNGAHRGPDRRGALLGDGQRRRDVDHAGADAGGAAPDVAGRPRALLRADLPQYGRHRDRDLARQGQVVVLAARHRDQPG